MLQAVYIANFRMKNDDLANLIKVGLSNFKNEIETMSEEEKEIENQMRWLILLKKFLSLVIKSKEEKD